jgi:hypothetical protein
MKRRPRRSTLPRLLAVLLLAGCAHARPAAVAPAPPAPAQAKAKAARYFHATPEESFWVSRGPDVERVIAGGARLELGPGGEVRAAAWDTALAHARDPLQGGLAVPERLGGGFVVWTRRRVFRAATFTGPLVPVAMAADAGVRGARAGLSSVIVVTDAGPRALLPGAVRVTPVAEPALADLVALSAQRAARLDVFGRFSITGDGGARWTEANGVAGSGIRQIGVGPRDLWVEGFQGRFLVDPSGRLEPADPSARGAGYEQAKAFQTVWKNGREHEDWPWGLQETTPLAVAVAAGGDVGDGTAFGVAGGAVVRVDLATGELVGLAQDWIPNGLNCQPVRAPDGVLFACGWDRSQGYGGYVLRSVGGAPPETEKAFGDDGSFVATDDGALGFVGPCRSEPRTPDPNDQSRWEVPSDTFLRRVCCVRRGPGDWVERQVDPGEGANVVAWVPRLDGTAAALALSTDPLPPPTGAGRVIEQGGVRLVRVYQEIAGRAWEGRADQSTRPGITGTVDRRFRMRDDGSIDGWLMPSSSGAEPGALAVTLDPAGIPTAHDPAPAGAVLLAGGSFGLSIADDGTLHETTDHGRTWRLAGRSPVPPGLGAGTVQACSALGCVLGAVVRTGWGDAAVDPRISSAPLAPLESVKVPRLVCTPRGAPVPLVAPPPAAAGTRQTLSTGWGDTVSIERDADAPTPPPAHRRPGVSAPAPPPSTAAPVAPPPPRASARPKTPAVLRTHTLVARQPFAPFAPPHRINATNGSLDTYRRPLVVPLLTPAGDVDVLVIGDRSELLVSGDHASVLPIVDPRRYAPGDAGYTGISLPGGRALVLGEVRRRVDLEDHGPGPVVPPLFLGADRGAVRRRPLALARRDDGTLGVIVADGSAPDTAGVAVLDRSAGSVGVAERLAPWSAVVAGGDPRCQKGGDPRAWEALLVIDPTTWLSLDTSALPGVALAHQGLFRVRWGAERVCLLGLDAAATDATQRGESARSFHLVLRWSGERDRGAALRTEDLLQDLACGIAAAGK